MPNLFRRACQAALLILLAWPQLGMPPSWFHTTWLGMAWGALVLTGMVATWARARLLWSLYAALAACLAQASLMPALRCQAHQAWFLVGCLMAAGWLIGKLTATAGVRAQLPPETAQLPQLGIWDLGLLTTLTACFCTLWPRVEPSFHLLCQLAPALGGGVILSWLAAQWAWRDQWNELTLSMALASLLLALLCILPLASWRSETLGPQFGQLVAWMLAGPLSVIAAQGTLVLAYLGLTRHPRAAPTSSHANDIDLHANKITLHVNNLRVN